MGSVRFTVPRFDVCFPDATTDTDCLAAQNDRQDIVANGIALSADGKYLLVAEHLVERSGELHLRQMETLKAPPDVTQH